MARDNSKQSEEAILQKPRKLTRRDLTRKIGAGAFGTALFSGFDEFPLMTGTAVGKNFGSQPWRPEYHFSPDSGWMNDPNGLVYNNGVYHLFYQAGEWPRRWDHATSTDLVSWTEHGTKIPATDTISPFSGGADIDKYNTAGFGEDAIICMYTGHHIDSGIEDQRIAYSTDNGETVHKYGGNPVIPSDHGAFRDPKPFWYEPDESWRMVVGRISGIENRPAGTEIWSSENAIDWTYESTYRSGGEGWECPDLFKLPVEGSDEMKWVLMVSPIETRRVEYHVGNFDGTKFTSEQRFIGDYGHDFYATQRWSNLPEEKNRGLHIGWMNNWNYAMEGTPDGYQEAQTIPRTIRLQDAEDTIELRQSPTEELAQARKETLAEMNSAIITPAPINTSLKGEDVAGRTLDLIATITPRNADQVGLRVRESDGQETVITYDTANSELQFDRTNSGMVFEDGFFGTESAPLELRDDGTIQLRVLVDRSSVEVYGNEGRRAMTHIVFPSWNSTGVSFFTEGGAAELEHFVAYRLDTEANDIESG
jgi:fructan beta-fructosidase